MPRDDAASSCPCSTERIPPRTISVIYEPSFTPSPSSAARNGVITSTMRAW